jgi:hypothetical protein
VLQESANCKLELKFAQQSGVPIVPVMLQADWRASDWLGIITAGALWTPLFNDLRVGVAGKVLWVQQHFALEGCYWGCSPAIDLSLVSLFVIQMALTLRRSFPYRCHRGFCHNAVGIVAQIAKSTVPSSLPYTTDDESGHSSTEDDVEFSVEEMRDELDRLMAALKLARTENAAVGGANAHDRRLMEAVQMKPTFSAVGFSGQCTLPASVPPLPGGLRVTAEMKELLTALLSTTSDPQVGFCGMGTVLRSLLIESLISSMRLIILLLA